MTTMTFGLQVLLFTAIGGLLGVTHFAGLQHNARLYLDRHRRAQAVAVHVLRLAIAVGAWCAIARFGAVALVSAAVGLWLGRGVVLRGSRSSS